jgi:hypothetical protein
MVSLVNVRLLIDAMVQQTTVLIAQLSTAAGIRAPLAHVADQVFVELARELEGQGVGRKVVADMFGLALRGYQKRVQRLTESTTFRERTLWEAVLEYVRGREHVTRREVTEYFVKDDEDALGSVLHDLVASGLVYSSGQGRSTVYQATAENAFAALVDETSAESVQSMVWAVVYHQPGVSAAELAERLRLARALVDAAISTLVGEGRLRLAGSEAEQRLEAATLVVPVDAESGWEAAVFDHFQAMVGAIGQKVRRGALRSKRSDRVGGSTITFDIRAGHPLEQETLDLLQRVRRDVNELWDRVCAHNATHPISEEERVRVRFYFGQSVIGGEEDQVVGDKS